MASAPIDFPGLAAALLDRAEPLMIEWLPDGHREGHEWKARNPTRGDRGIGSFSVNLTTGAWADFATDDRGGDLISLYAYLHGLNNGQAARQLMERLGWTRPEADPPPRGTAQPKAGTPHADGETPPPESDTRPEPPPLSEEQRAARAELARRAKDVPWRTIAPVPPGAPAPTFKHYARAEADRVATWAYERDGQVYGHVVRFRTSDGGKDTLPYTYAQDDSTGTQRWSWRQWDEPRPLYLAAGLLAADPRLVPVVLVEGEKCAEAGHKLLGHEFDFVSWPGGSKAWARADWSWLQGRVVIMWPDCDAQRVRLTKEEREANVDPLTKPILPEERQPGMVCMVKIGSILVADQGCSVTLCKIPAPGDVASGWDIADAIDQGWDAELVRAFLRNARTFVPPDDAARAKANQPLPGAGAGQEDAPDVDAWRAKLLTSQKGAIAADRANVILALDGLPGAGIKGIAACEGVIAFNEFSNQVMKLKPTPWGTPAGPWLEHDELELGDWLTREHWLPTCSRQTLEEAVAVVAHRHGFHPVRAQFEALRGTWDGTKRLGSWLARVCTEPGEVHPESDQGKYLARVGTWVCMALVARIYTPGCKFDFMLVLEGKQGRGKSTLAEILGCGYFADTGLVLGEKDSYQNLQGKLVYEWGELDSLAKSDVRKVKNFVASKKDTFRATFDRRPKDYPRQCIFVGTTNERHYLTDPTGNRRFWPVRITRLQIDLAWVREHLDQLLAEAIFYLDAGEPSNRFHPNHKEQEKLFDPQQGDRQIDNGLESQIRRYLYDEGQKLVGSTPNGSQLDEVSLSDLMSYIGITVDKQTQVLMREASSCMERMGWERHRSSAPKGATLRPYLYRRPDQAAQPEQSAPSTAPTQGQDEDDDVCPF